MPGVPVCPLPKGWKEPGSVGTRIIAKMVAAAYQYFGIDRPRLVSVSEAATELNASEAYVRRLLLRQRLFGINVGSPTVS